MGAKIELSGLKEFTAALAGQRTKADVAAHNFIAQGGQIIVKNARREFTSVVENRQGTQRLLHNSPGFHKAKGETLVRSGQHIGGSRPNTRTGYLQRSITADPPAEIGLGRWMTQVGPRAIYGRRIELGYPGGEGRGRQHTRAFPYLSPGLATSQPELRALRLRLFQGV